MGLLVVFRLDVTAEIGAGHAMRCLAIAKELEQIGVLSLFVVSCAESAERLESFGVDSVVLDSDPHHLTAWDANRLVHLCRHVNAKCCVVDSYATTREFEEALWKKAHEQMYLALIDDQFTFAGGNQRVPYGRPFDLVLNYSFYADELAYRRAYEATGTRLLLGPSYAPLRDEFRREEKTNTGAGASRTVGNVLVTVGSTNPNHWLERITEACLQVIPENTALHVVVGPSAMYGYSEERVVVHRNVCSMSGLMEICQLAVSAAGSTLYELCAMRVPTIAIPVVENQEQNAESFAKGGYGLACSIDSTASELSSMIRVATDALALGCWPYGEKMRCVDACGAKHVAQVLADAVNNTERITRERSIGT